MGLVKHRQLPLATISGSNLAALIIIGSLFLFPHR